VQKIELSIDELRARRGNKWRRFPPDVLPAPVADMDFAVPDAVQEAIEAVVRIRDYGYGTGSGAREGDEGLPFASPSSPPPTRTGAHTKSILTVCCRWAI
jgi:hypothetical protein